MRNRIRILRISVAGLHFESPHLHCERPRPSMAPFCASKALEFDFDADMGADSAFENNANPVRNPGF
jgi:hypothetical protein